MWISNVYEASNRFGPLELVRMKPVVGTYKLTHHKESLIFALPGSRTHVN